eukprot:GHVS01072876.1.p1 GENE.GHVS01072876.1~~GHVS01072876.1.p1  ORF type:complete len:273 (-),score=36.93 GHVS01072876.1:1347-2165(-)
MDLIRRNPLLRKQQHQGGSSLGIVKCDVTALLANTEVVGLYFSAHWCPPCRQFTPQLGSVYSAAKAQRKAFEIIFISSDQSQDQFTEYYNSMADWLAVPFEATALRSELKTRFAVKSIPALIILKVSTGEVLKAEGRHEVLSPNFISSLPNQIEADMQGVTLEMLLEKIEDKSTKEKAMALNTIGLIISNLLSNPGDPKYCTIKKSNKTINEKLPHDDYFKILKLAGFVESPPDQLCFPETANTTKAKEIRDVLLSILTSVNVDDDQQQTTT